MVIFWGILHDSLIALAYTWWIWVFLLVFPIFAETWVFWKNEDFLHGLDYVLLELRMPREVKRSPMAMEQVLAAIHALRNAPGLFSEKWIKGEVTIPYSLELVSLGGEVHFYVRAFRQQQNLFEAAFFSYYPDVEVVEVEDYVKNLPENVTELTETGHDLWGTELILAKDEGYPIKSYLDYESPDENKQYDPISHFLEVLGKVQREEFLGIQLVITPASDEWRKHTAHLVEALRSNKKESHGGSHGGASLGLEFPHILPVFPVAAHGAKEDDSAKALMRTPVETDVLKAVQENLAFPAFETVVRVLYVSPKEIFANGIARRGVVGAFNQYASQNMNSFTANHATATRPGSFFLPGRQILLRKERILAAYHHREVPPHNEMGRKIMSRFMNPMGSKHFILTTRSLATLFHPPTYQVLTAPHVKRIESRKAGPPAGLAIYGGEEEIEKYR
jgi:hypothetical protein